MHSLWWWVDDSRYQRRAPEKKEQDKFVDTALANASLPASGGSKEMIRRLGRKNRKRKAFS
jgi:hypothetical protein